MSLKRIGFLSLISRRWKHTKSKWKQENTELVWLLMKHTKFLFLENLTWHLRLERLIEYSTSHQVNSFEDFVSVSEELVSTTIWRRLNTSDSSQVIDFTFAAQFLLHEVENWEWKVENLVEISSLDSRRGKLQELSVVPDMR